MAQSSWFVLPVREWALRTARRSAESTNQRGIYTDREIFKHHTIFCINREGTTFTQPAIRGQKPQEIYSL